MDPRLTPDPRDDGERRSPARIAARALEQLRDRRSQTRGSLTTARNIEDTKTQAAAVDPIGVHSCALSLRLCVSVV
jgi:hypothetical protein